MAYGVLLCTCRVSCGIFAPQSLPPQDSSKASSLVLTPAVLEGAHLKSASRCPAALQDIRGRLRTLSGG